MKICFSKCDVFRRNIFHASSQFEFIEISSTLKRNCTGVDYLTGLRLSRWHIVVNADPALGSLQLTDVDSVTDMCVLHLYGRSEEGA
jgi:hypothetical protein